MIVNWSLPFHNSFARNAAKTLDKVIRKPFIAPSLFNAAATYGILKKVLSVVLASGLKLYFVLLWAAVKKNW